MTVAELIEELKKYPSELTVRSMGFNYLHSSPITKRSIARDKETLVIVGDDFMREENQ